MRYTEDELRSLFQHKFDRKVWTGFLQNFMEEARLRSVPEEFHTPSENEKGFFLGEYVTSDHYRIGLFQFDVKAASVARKRVGLRNLVKSLINPNWGEFDAALAVFVSDSDWRLSFICDIKEEKTAPKRFTYVFGEESLLYRTPVSRLFAIQGNITFASLKDAFSVEKVSKDFFREYRDIYADFVQYLTGSRYVKKTQGSGYELKSFPSEPQNMAFYEALGKDDKRARDFVKKMMGRITFLYFLQQKGWMCGDKNYMFHLFESSSDKNYFLKKVLVPLFFGVLNTKPEERKAVFAKRKWNDELRKGWETIPYLNGGLFEPDEEDLVVDACSTHIFRQKDFEELFEFYSHYNFTIDENDPTDAEVGVDPEMLGKIFESLLEDNKDKGAYYTPKEIVQYMCQESLVAYLVTKTGIEEGRLREFVKEPEDNKDGFTEDERYKILDGVLSVKICDPAIGSGAFPIGLLNELVRCKEAIYGDKKGCADIKREIIRDNIYGVDIEKGAVDIARLRFWLSLVVDEDTPSPLPNLDYKIMQGNSLLEWYNGVDLSHLTDAKGSDLLLNTESSDELKKKLAKLLKRYFGESDHDKKFALKEAIKAAITEILDIAGVEIPDGIDIAENSQFFLWHTWFNEVFTNNGGFDICLGNPPYINVKRGIDETVKRSYLSNYTLAKGQFDLFTLFIEQGFKLSAGVVCMIVPKPLINNENYEACRKLILDNGLSNIVIGSGIFENAGVESCIFISHHDEYSRVSEVDEKHHIIEKHRIENSIFKELPYAMFNPEITSDSIPLLKTLAKDSIPLANVLYVLRGIEAGKKDDCISIDRTKYQLLRGQDVGRYSISFGGLYCHYDPNDESKFKPLSLYQGKKIMIRRVGNEIMCALDTSSKLCLNTIYCAHSVDSAFSEEYILAILNSSVIRYWFKTMFVLTDKLFPYIRKSQLDMIPIKKAAPEIMKRIEALVNDITLLRADNPSADVSSIEAEIDRLVYDLYDVPQEERHI